MTNKKDNPTKIDNSNPYYFTIRIKGDSNPFDSMDIAEVRRAAKGLEMVIENSHDGIFISDGKGKILLVNSAWERICGMTRDFIVGKYAQDMVSQGFWSNSTVLSVLNEKKELTTMLEMTRGDKVGQKIMGTGIPVFNSDNSIKMVVANIRDITEIVNLKEQLEETQQLNVKYVAELEQMRIQQVKHDNIIARSPKTKKALEMAAQVAKVNSTVLITGESGVGKEIIANLIHCLSHRSKGPLIKINCGAIPENLLESELFGYEEGAFTGARKQGKPGMFELAENGTLFLDEIGDLSLNLQVKMLRVLQHHEIIRIGGLKPISVDARIIAATNKELLEMVRLERFRDDLYYRLNVVSIDVPPLRERKEDIPLLSMHFLNKINEKYQFSKTFSSAVIDIFLDYSWPGNIRELENVIERMVVMTEEKEIQIKHLPVTIKSNGHSEVNFVLSENLSLKSAVEHLEKKLITQALKKHGSTRKAAKALKVDQSTIVRKARKYALAMREEHSENNS